MADVMASRARARATAPLFARDGERHRRSAESQLHLYSQTKNRHLLALL
jgi:hypothetical protein